MPARKNRSDKYRSIDQLKNLTIDEKQLADKLRRWHRINPYGNYWVRPEEEKVATAMIKKGFLRIFQQQPVLIVEVTSKFIVDSLTLGLS